ncbi:MAG: toll/interleukin-1 receptor domain-containing protein, partial [Humidesulfovibrio sp.]|nr:toll/interleukin-1 receptor domain-containing protein [Humidesulfovibrio sp.]
MNEAEANPCVFISYCWYKEETREWVLRLAEDLQGLGVHVTIDAWDLKEGQDVYAFMESCVTSTEIDRVLIVCDKAYAQKADARSGGVGAETAIISKKVYDKVDQTKFFPIILERAEDGQPCLPTYL